MRQRVAVGRAFAPSPCLLLMDEPFGSMDAITREGLQETLARLYESEPQLNDAQLHKGKLHAVVFVTHDVGEALFLCDRICVLTARPGSVREILEVPFRRPRNGQVKRDPLFVEMKYSLEDMLRGEKSLQAQRG
jgi:NitT/TauT family transport system ATP-binding protein